MRLFVDTPKTTNIICNGQVVRIAAFKLSDYNDAIALIPKVSRCPQKFSREEVEEFLATGTFHPFCARRASDNALVGYAELYRLPHMGRIPDARLERVIVEPEFRGNGLASKLCSLMIDWAKNHYKCGRVDLTVENPIARHVYENKLGFQEVTTTLMRRDFSSSTQKPSLMPQSSGADDYPEFVMEDGSSPTMLDQRSLSIAMNESNDVPKSTGH